MPSINVCINTQYSKKDVLLYCEDSIYELSFDIASCKSYITNIGQLPINISVTIDGSSENNVLPPLIKFYLDKKEIKNYGDTQLIQDVSLYVPGKDIIYAFDYFNKIPSPTPYNRILANIISSKLYE